MYRPLSDHLSVNLCSALNVYIPALSTMNAVPFVLVSSRARTIPFSGKPEERPVLHNRAADAATIQAIIRVGQTCLFLRFAGNRIEEVLRLPPDGPCLVEAAAVIVVRARLGRHV